ncbi:MAG: phosphodiesterase [Phycisphaerales bacterium]|nr:phosphodiesterase [Phycisphaerales bacterium]
MNSIRKVAVFGLDCAEPSLVFDRWRDDLPHLRGLMERGTWGQLTSCIPPITVPAWSCMTSSCDPGALGIYGFRNRADHSYDKLSIATSLAVRYPRLWNILTDHDRDSIIVGVPGTYPITRPVRGCLITSFLTPDINAEYTWPPALKKEIADLVGEYMLDVRDFRTDDKQWLLRQIYEMTDKRFTVANHLLESRPWDLFFMVEMGVDRIHHGFWSFMAVDHHRYAPGNPFENAIHDYYVHVDGLIGKALTRIDAETTAIWVVSDHGARTMIGGFCLNTWLMNEGYLHLKNPPKPGQKFDVKEVDWSRTTAWGDGGYYGRVFLNVRGREPQGVVSRDGYESVRDEIKRKLEALPDHQGRPMGNVAHRPGDLYKQSNGVPPDLIVIFGELAWRSVGTVGNESVYTFENDTGPDDANHAQQGMYILARPGGAAAGRRDASIYDVAPTILGMLGLPIPGHVRGRSLPP